HYVTVIATQKLDDKDKQVGIFFDRNRLKISDLFRVSSCSSIFVDISLFPEVEDTFRNLPTVCPSSRLDYSHESLLTESGNSNRLQS
ncbi:MAG: hypothetical protein BECKG1743F_GA0114225_101506, partial [Candidatus Kentron sp. G]